MNAVPWIGYGVIAAFVFVAVAVAGAPTIALLRRLSFKQQAYEDAPQSHAIKSGTPTMGGVLFALGLVLACAMAAVARDPRLIDVVELAALGLACGAIGLIDDYAGIVRGRNRGLGARVKFALTALAGAAFLLALGLTPGHVATSAIALGNFTLGVPAWAWYALGLAAILSTTHAVNLTDGLDGLAAGTIVAPLVLLAYIAARATTGATVGVIDVATVGAALGFLVYNRHPARLFMGDTGSLLLGGVLAGSAIMLDQQLLLPLIGGVFAAEAMSVILQVAYFKRTGKRIFRMSPLHHHFELAGWPETTVTARFWATSFALALVGLLATVVGRPAT